MKWKQQTKEFMMITNWKKLFSLHGWNEKKSVL